MITKNSVNYTSLFEKATNLLKQYDGQSADFEINNIDEYFQHIKTLAAIERHDNDHLTVPVADDTYIDPIYTMLPIEEELFEINANTREIKIPKHFSTYGVGVEGDEIAEIIYFSIDRYFDAVDLADMEILIQWNRGDELSENLDLTYKRSLEYASGKIVFGWPVSSAMTEEPGNINFAVRFYRIDNNNKLWYSFSTKTATIKIQKGLDFTLTKDSIAKASNYSDWIYETLRNTESPAKGYVVATPTFIEYALKQAGADNFVNVAELVCDIDAANSENPCKLRTRAYITEEALENGEKMGISGLKYEWWYKNKEGKASKIDNMPIAAHYEPVTPSTLLNNEYYYYKDENGEYHIYTSMSGEQDLYQKYSVLTPDKAGVYFAKAINTYNFNENVENKSAEWTIPYPDKPSLNVAYETSYRIPKGGSVDIEIDISENEALTGTKSARWYVSTDANGESKEFVVSGTKVAAQTEGYYFLEVANERNNSVETILSNAIHVLYNPSAVKITGRSEELVAYEAGVTKLWVTAEPDGSEGQIQYKWQINSEEEWTDVNCLLNEYKPTAKGEYRCVITNVYEGLATEPSYETFRVMSY